MSTLYTETVVYKTISETTTIFSGDSETKRVDPNDRNAWQYQYSISLDELEEIMLELRQNGANRVEISYHTDHQEYEFVGTYLEENLDPKAALALKIKEAQEDLNLRIQYHRNYKDNVAKLEELMERDKEHLNELLKQYEVQ